ncbi:hypothetical protein BUALT_Bualt10G0077800 [Buddleja alternifolia]|uniref:Carotenoid cleavage dioxygenase 4 n=1 Tax=Buddleja alternifolia TaxID=168488 RepID=A0AAV6WW32_9LAMI|nr:hypothetical protein BUALT_Bualt10G0077800 [Buddleja alternifolia]
MEDGASDLAGGIAAARQIWSDLKKSHDGVVVSGFKEVAESRLCVRLWLCGGASVDVVSRLEESSRLSLPPTACEVVEGSLPPCLNGGAYIQNSPNPQFMPHGPYHVVDGDGMLHSIKISQGKATFCSRYITTYKYNIERVLGYPVFPNLFAMFNSRISAYTTLLNFARVITGQINPLIHGLGTANTSLSLIGGKLFALCEYDLPYGIEMKSDGDDLITIGRHDFHASKKILMNNMTAHPKIDSQTGEVFAFKYHVIPPFLTFFRIDGNGRKQKDVPITIKRASVIHDFAVSKNYAIFPDTQIAINPLEVTRCGRVMTVDLDKTPRLGVIERYAEDEREMWWIDVPGLNILHVVNAWEEDDGGKIVILASNVLSVEHTLDRMDLNHFSMEKIMIDVEERKVVNRVPVSTKSLDFGGINPEYAGKKNRYVYAAQIETMPKILGVVKIDLSLLLAGGDGDCTVASRSYGPGCYGSEPLFVPREPSNQGATTEEDDGYLLSYVHNENTQESLFVVMDAKSPTLEIVASVKLPRRVPYGFHSIFVKQSDLRRPL